MSTTEEQELDKILRDFAITVKAQNLYDPSFELDAEIHKTAALLSQHTQRARVSIRKDAENKIRINELKNVRNNLATDGHGSGIAYGDSTPLVMVESIDARIAQLSTKDSTNKEEA